MDYSVHDDIDLTIHSLSEETKRRRNRLEKMGRNFTQIEGKLIDGGSIRPYENGIMKVKTLKESLIQGASAEVKRKRRNLNRRMNHILRSKNITSSNTSTTASSSLSGATYSVSFDSIFIREYPLLPGDNPSITDGPPMTFGWIHEDEYSYPINEYELYRLDDRRVPSQMRVPRAVRFQRLLDHGNSQSDIKKSIKSVNQLKSQIRQIRKVENDHASANPFKRHNLGNKKRVDKLDQSYLSLLNNYSQDAEKSFEIKLREISKIKDSYRIGDSESSQSLSSATWLEDTIRTSGSGSLGYPQVDPENSASEDILQVSPNDEQKEKRKVRFTLNRIDSISETSGLDNCFQHCYVPTFITSCTKPKFEPSPLI